MMRMFDFSGQLLWFGVEVVDWVKHGSVFTQMYSTVAGGLGVRS
jgi:hypothetical protein